MQLNNEGIDVGILKSAYWVYRENSKEGALCSVLLKHPKSSPENNRAKTNFKKTEGFEDNCGFSAYALLEL